MKKNKFILALSLFLVMAFNLSAVAQQSTTVTVRALAKDAKFIGNGMDGAMITIVETSTGDTLATGLTKGSTGDTERLVKEPVKRYEQLSTSDAAKFVTDIRIKEPTKVTISATGPQSPEHAKMRVSVQKWLIPGKDIVGDGIILEVSGFVVSNRLPKADKSYSSGDAISIKVHIVMMCGCPTAEGGLWDSSEYEIKAQIRKGDKLIKEVPLSFSGQTNIYEGSFLPKEAGEYEVLVYAFHPQTENTGLDQTAVTVQ